MNGDALMLFLMLTAHINHPTYVRQYKLPFRSLSGVQVDGPAIGQASSFLDKPRRFKELHFLYFIREAGK